MKQLTHWFELYKMIDTVDGGITAEEWCIREAKRIGHNCIVKYCKKNRHGHGKMQATVCIFRLSPIEMANWKRTTGVSQKQESVSVPMAV